MRLSVLLIVFLPLISFGQSMHYQLDQSIPVEVNGTNLLSPWAGGLNSAQINSIDLDFDGDDDLAVFDRTANKLFTFVNHQGQYLYSPEFETYFPSTVNNWMLLRDFNCDGKKDIFTSSVSGILVFVNVSSNGALKWRPFNNGGPLLTIGFSGSINLKVNLSDLPAIDDVDGDGDLDILNARFVGVGTIEWHRNMSVENAGKCDSLQMVRVTQEWGNFEECECGLFAFSGKDCSQVGGRVQHDEGKSLLTLDFNQDGLRDLLFSEEDCTSLYGLPNDSSNQKASFSSFIDFPAGKPSELLFPAAYYEAVDFDGTKDLVVSSNISSTVFSSLDFSNSVWTYKNTATDLKPQFSFAKYNFLQENMIDLGSYASPSFADVDDDNDLDLFISYWSGPDTVSSIHHFENSGTIDQPSFRFVTNDFLQFSKFGLYNIKIQFVDVNADGRTDLAFTASNKATGITQLYFLFNQASGALDFKDQLPAMSGFQIDPSENVFLSDVNSDGLVDAIVGKVDGSLQYWKNVGSANSFFLVLSNSSFLGLGSSITRYSMSAAMADLKHDGRPDLILGNKGSLLVFSDFQTNQNPVADTVFIENPRKGTYENRSLGGSIRVAAADLNFNFSPLIFVGTIAGGLYNLKPEVTNSSDQPLFFCWPNPVLSSDKIFMRANQPANVQIYNVIGQRLSNSFSLGSNETETVSHNLAPGLYFARVSLSSQTLVYKFVVR